MERGTKYLEIACFAQFLWTHHRFHFFSFARIILYIIVYSIEFFAKVSSWSALEVYFVGTPNFRIQICVKRIQNWSKKNWNLYYTALSMNDCHWKTSITITWTSIECSCLNSEKFVSFNRLMMNSWQSREFDSRLK